jgi:hypothetical protein
MTDTTTTQASGGATGGVRTLLRLEGLALAVACMVFYSYLKARGRCSRFCWWCRT